MKDLAPQQPVRLSRRQIIRGLGAAAVVGLPGCNDRVATWVALQRTPTSGPGLVAAVRTPECV